MPRAKKFLAWKEEDMLAAIATFRAGGISFRKCADQFNVPKSTLRDRITGRVVHGTKNGPESKLSTEDENKLAAYLIDTSRQGYGKSKEIIMFMATQIAVKRGKKVLEGGLSEMWWRSFLKRHPEISLRTSQNFGMVRTLVTRQTVEAFYKRLLETLQGNGIGNLLDKPHLIFNADESGFVNSTQSTKSSLPPRGQDTSRAFPKANMKKSLFWRALLLLETASPQCSFSRV